MVKAKLPNIELIQKGQHTLCDRCGGTGRMPFSVYHGICFRCNGGTHDPRCRPCKENAWVKDILRHAGEDFGKTHPDQDHEAHRAAWKAALASIGIPEGDPRRMKSWLPTFKKGVEDGRMVARTTRCPHCRMGFGATTMAMQEEMLTKHMATIHPEVSLCTS